MLIARDYELKTCLIRTSQLDYVEQAFANVLFQCIPGELQVLAVDSNLSYRNHAVNWPHKQCPNDKLTIRKTCPHTQTRTDSPLEKSPHVHCLAQHMAHIVVYVRLARSCRFERRRGRHILHPV